MALVCDRRREAQINRLSNYARPTDDIAAKDLLRFAEPWQVAPLSIEEARAEWGRRGHSQERVADLDQSMLMAWVHRIRQDQFLLVDWEQREAMTRREFIRLSSLAALSQLVRVPRGLVTAQSMGDAATALIESLGSTTRTVYVPSDHLDEPERNFMYGQMLAQQGHWREAIPFFERAAEQWPLDSRRGRALIEAAQQWINLGNYEAAEKKLNKVLGADRHTVDALTRARALDKMGWAKHYQGLYDSSIQLFDKARREAQKYDDKPLESDALHFIARNYYSLAMQGDNKEALQKALWYFNEAYRSVKRFGSPEGVLAHQWRWQARVLEGLGEIGEAQKLRMQAFQVFKDEPGRYGTAHILRDEGINAFHAGQHRRAEKNLYEALELWGEIRYAKGLADCLTDLALGYWESGEHAKLDDIVDLALIALLVYPYPRSLPGQAALDILQTAQHERPERFSEHLVEAPDRVANRTGPFRFAAQVERTIDVESVQELLALLLNLERSEPVNHPS